MSPAAPVPPPSPSRGIARRNTWLRLARAAWLSLALHLAAGLSMALILGRGLPSNPDLNDRLRFLVDQQALWVAGWIPWNLAALSVLYFYWSFAGAHRGDWRSTSRLMSAAVVWGGVAVVFDLTAEGLEMFNIPRLAERAIRELEWVRQGQVPPVNQAWPIGNRVPILLTGCIANGLYTAAAVLLTWATRHAYARWIWTSGVGVGIAGTWLSIAAGMGSTLGMVLSNAFLVPLILLWQAGVALDAGRRAKIDPAASADLSPRDNSSPA